MFKYITLYSALLIAACAEFFSIYGIGQLFSGAPKSTMIMAGALGLGKLVSITFLYRYWNDMNRGFRFYFLVAAFVLMNITSMGIFGYLNMAYSTEAVVFKTESAQIDVISTQQNSLNQMIQRNEQRLTTLNSVRVQQENRSDNLVGKSGLATQQRAIAEANKEITQVQKETSNLYKQRDSLEILKVQRTGKLNTSSKIGTFNNIAKSFNVPLDTVAKYFILALIFVFDPLSLSLLIAYNTIVKKEQDRQLVKKTPEVPTEEGLPEVRDDAPEVINTTNELGEVSEVVINPEPPIPEHLAGEELRKVQMGQHGSS